MPSPSLDDTFLIERASWRDLNQVRYLEQACFPKDAWPLLDLISVLTFPNIVRLKATLEGKMIGFIAGDIRRDESLSWIATIGVLPEYRNQGIGHRLLEACEAELPTPNIRLCVRTTNTEAIRLYNKCGYTVIGRWARYYNDGEEATVMEKKSPQ
jgi:ribosomal protein S18 acetylase RimI-like enzyme